VGRNTRAKPGSTRSARSKTRIDWAKVDRTTEADIARHARADRTQPPSERAWRKLVQDGRVSLHPPARVDVRAIREKLKLSQTAFAARFGFTAAAVRQWEQGRRQPHGPARVLLTIIDREPNAVRRALEDAAE
jgi:putative transcriptional regulator